LLIIVLSLEIIIMPIIEPQSFPQKVTEGRARPGFAFTRRVLQNIGLRALDKSIGSGVAQMSGTFVPNRTYFYSAFESFTGWNLNTAGISGSNLNARVSTGAVINTKRVLGFDGVSVITDFSKNSEFSVGVVAPITNATINLNIGGDDNGAGESYYGFRISNGSVSTIYSNGVTEFQQAIEGVSADVLNVYKVVFTAKSKIDFYVNGILKDTQTFSLPTGTMDAVVYITIKNTVAADKVLNVAFVAFAQDI